jgi:hypothetical protein
VDESVEVPTEERRRLVELERSATTAGTLGFGAREDSTCLAGKEGLVGFRKEEREPTRTRRILLDEDRDVLPGFG